MSNDQDDWAAALGGDGRAFGRVFVRNRERVRRHAVRICLSLGDAEDVLAVTFFEAWNRRDQVRFVDGSLAPWLLVTATNVARNTARSARRYRELLERLPAPEPFTQPDDETLVEVLSAIRQLPATERGAAYLCLVEGYSEREAAEALGIRPGTVKSRLSRARSRLALQLREHESPWEGLHNGI